MNPAQLLAHFDRISDAPEAVPRLRRFILDLAVRGKLLEQFQHTDQIELNGIASPTDWTIRTVEQVASEIQPGFACSKSHQMENGFVHLRTHNISTEGQLNFDLIIRVDPRKIDRGKVGLKPGDIVFNNTNSQELVGKTCTVTQAYDYAFSNHLTRIRLVPEVDSAFFVLTFRLLLKSGYFASLCNRWIGQAGINTKTLKDIQIAIPPLAEQNRIVAKVDELMGLCDRLEAAQAERESRRDRLAAASLARLNQPADPESFRDHARFHLRHFPRFTTRPDQVAPIRQTILNLAVRGKLVPQDPKDKSIIASIQCVMDRRAELVRAKRVRRKKLDEYGELGRPKDLPTTWSVERLGNLVDPENTISYGVLVPGNEVADGVPFVRAQDLALTSHPLRPNKTIAPDIEKAYSRTRLRGGEILLCVVGSIGKLGIVPPSWAGANIARAVARILPVPEISRDYLLVVLQGNPVQTYFKETTRTLAQPTLNVGLIEETPIPLPPLSEQHRIVAKVEQLMALCDRLETELTAAQTESRRLLEAVLHEALAPAR